jgi:hypothetical protein
MNLRHLSQLPCNREAMTPTRLAREECPANLCSSYISSNISLKLWSERTLHSHRRSFLQYGWQEKLKSIQQIAFVATGTGECHEQAQPRVGSLKGWMMVRFPAAHEERLRCTEEAVGSSPVGPVLHRSLPQPVENGFRSNGQLQPAECDGGGEQTGYFW